MAFCTISIHGEREILRQNHNKHKDANIQNKINTRLKIGGKAREFTLSMEYIEKRKRRLKSGKKKQKRERRATGRPNS